jgi:hypothetical protein
MVCVKILQESSQRFQNLKKKMRNQSVRSVVGTRNRKSANQFLSSAVHTYIQYLVSSICGLTDYTTFKIYA